MKKLLAILAVLVAGVVSSASAVAASAGGTTSVRADTEEPTWVIPLVVAFVVLGVVAAVLAGRGRRSDTSA